MHISEPIFSHIKYIDRKYSKLLLNFHKKIKALLKCQHEYKMYHFIALVKLVGESKRMKYTKNRMKKTNTLVYIYFFALNVMLNQEQNHFILYSFFSLFLYTFECDLTCFFYCAIM